MSKAADGDSDALDLCCSCLHILSDHHDQALTIDHDSRYSTHTCRRLASARDTGTRSLTIETKDEVVSMENYICYLHMLTSPASREIIQQTWST